MQPTGTPPSRINQEYLLDDWPLPLKRNSHVLIRFNAFEWKLLPKMDEKWRKISLKCTLCTNKEYMQSWPINWTTLSDHYEGTHKLTLDEMRLQESKGPEGAGANDSTKPANKIDHFFVTGAAQKYHGLKGLKKRGVVCVDFDKEEYMRLLLMMIVSNNLAFSLVDTESFRDFILFLREDVPLVDRHALRRMLAKIFGAESNSMKKKFAQNTGSFAITIDEWNSGNNIDFLGITLHFYNNDFKLENYTIGFEMLNENLSYTGEVVYETMMKVLRNYGIEKRIISITRDNAGPMNVMMKMFNNASSTSGVEFNGDIRCVGHILNLVTDCILNYTFYKKTATQKFIEDRNTHESTAVMQRMQVLPDMMRSIITQFRYSHKAKNSFKNLVSIKKIAEGKQKIPENVVKDNATRWLSTYRMIDRFIYFRPEIMKVLRIVHLESDKEAHMPEDYQITDADWEYLTNIRDMLEMFRAPTIKLQGSFYPTIHETIPMVDEVLGTLDKLLCSEFVIGNPFIACGIREAKTKLLEYYPIYDESIKRLKPLYLAMILDPRFKIQVFTAAGFSKEKIASIRKYFDEVFSQYLTNLINDIEQTPVDSTRVSSFGFGRFRVARQENRVQLVSEIDRYLTEPIEAEDQDPVAYHKTRKGSFPIISRMARDYLAVSAMSAPAEALFSRMGDVISKKRNRLLPTTIRMLAILKSRGIIQEEEIPEDNLSTEDDDSPSDEINEEREKTEADDILIIDDIDDDIAENESGSSKATPNSEE